jgi:predicted HTH transcriptional regulator
MKPIVGDRLVRNYLRSVLIVFFGNDNSEDRSNKLLQKYHQKVVTAIANNKLRTQTQLKTDLNSDRNHTIDQIAHLVYLGAIA